MFLGIVKRTLKRNVCCYCLLLCVYLMLVGCHRVPSSIGKTQIRPKSKKPNVLLITIDTLRADHLGCYGYGQIKTPTIDNLAKGGIIFEQAFTPVPVTLPSHASILTGTYPPFHGVRNNATFTLDSRSITFAEVLKDEGYQTGAVIGAYVLDSRFGLNQGFDVYEDGIDRQKESIIQLYVERKAEETSQSAIKWLSQKKDAPFFLWIHYFDPHAAYTPPLHFQREYSNHPYDGEIAYTDQQIGVVLDYLRSCGELDNTVIALTADHGESLGEHGEDTHAIFMYDATVHVPLIIHYPKAFEEPKKISDPVCTIDIMPTILGLLKFDIPSCVQGQNLTSLISHPGSFTERVFYCETHYPALNHGWSPLEGIRTREWKYILAPQPELYHLAIDPKETKNLIAGKPQEVERMLHEFKSLKQKVSENGISWSKGADLDNEARQKLMSLGYIWTTPSKEEKTIGPDPKEMIGLLVHLNRAISYYTMHEYEKAEAELKIILAKNPRDTFARFSLASNYMQSGKVDEALKEFNHVASEDKNFMDVHNHLGALYEKLGQDDKALEEYNMAVSLNSTFAEAYNNRGALAMKMNNLKEAREDFFKAVSLSVAFPEAYNNLGISYEKEKNHTEAVAYFKKALEFRTFYPDAANNLGCTYIEMGDFEQAKQVLEKMVKNNAGHVEAHNNLGIVYNHLGEYARAILELEETLALDPNYVDAYINLGISYFEQEEYALAQKQYEKALNLEPHNAQAHINLGIVRARLGDLDRAIESYQRAVTLDKDSLEAHVNLAKAYKEKGLGELEIEEWKRIIDLDPQNLDASIGLGLACVQSGHYSEALPVWQKVVTLSPDDPRGYVSLGDLYVRLGQSSQAQENYQKALQLDENNVESHLGLGALFYQQGSLDLAIREWHKVISLDTQNTQAYFNLAAALTQKGFLGEAMSAYQKVIELNWEDAEAHFYLGLAYEQQGQFEKAMEEYRNAIMIRPDFIEAHNMLRRLQ